MPNLDFQIFEKKFPLQMHLRVDVLLKPQSKLLPQAKASIVSNGRLLFEILGIKAQIKKMGK